jgi:hypothetical protein
MSILLRHTVLCDVADQIFLPLLYCTVQYLSSIGVKIRRGVNVSIVFQRFLKFQMPRTSTSVKQIHGRK